jgi:hypothetical protein
MRITYDDISGREIPPEEIHKMSITVDDNESPFVLEIDQLTVSAFTALSEGEFDTFQSYIANINTAIQQIVRAKTNSLPDDPIRAWANDQGMNLGKRGPIPLRIREAYYKAIAINGEEIALYTPSTLCHIHSGFKHDMFYIVANETQVKIGVSNDDGKSRLENHKSDGFNTVLFIRTGLNPGVACMAEQRIMSDMSAADVFTVRGNEYYPIAYADEIIAKAVTYLP